MFVGLNLFSIICTKMLRSTPGNNSSTESAVALADTLSPATRGWARIGLDVLILWCSWLVT